MKSTTLSESAFTASTTGGSAAVSSAPSPTGLMLVLMIRSRPDAMDRAEESLRPVEQDENDERERDGVAKWLHRFRQQGLQADLDRAQEEAADDGARQVTDATEDRRDEGLQDRHKAHQR